MPGSAAETRADACRPSGAATLPVQVPLRYWFVGGSAVAVSGFGPGLSSSPSLLVTSASTGPGGAPVGGATVVVRAGRAPASFWRALLACSFATFTAWRPRLETASQPASRPRPTSGRLHRLHAGLRRCWVFAGTSRPPPTPRPRCLGCFAVSLFARNETNRGPIAWRQPGKLGLPRTRGPASTPSSPPGRSSPVAEGLARSSEPMTTPCTRGRREAGCRQGPQPLHLHGLDPPRALVTAAWLGRDRPVAGRRRWPRRRVRLRAPT